MFTKKNPNLVLKGRIISKYGTQADFADAIDKGAPYVSEVTTGRRPLPEEEKRKWAEVLSCSVETIFPEYSE